MGRLQQRQQRLGEHENWVVLLQMTPFDTINSPCGSNGCLLRYARWVYLRIRLIGLA